MLKYLKINWGCLAIVSIVICVAVLFAFIENIDRNMEKLEGRREISLPFAKVGAPELDKLLKSQCAGQYFSRDQLITAKGTFACVNMEQIEETLKSVGFASTTKVDFVDKGAVDWEPPVGTIVRQSGFERNPGPYDQLKLFELEDSECVFHFQSAWF